MPESCLIKLNYRPRNKRGRKPTRDAEPSVALSGRALETRNNLVEKNILLVHWLINRKYNWALSLVEYDELVAYGCEGLIKAADRYDPKRGSFSTYAVWWIRQSITRSLMNEADLIRIPVHEHAKRAKIRKVTHSGTEHNAAVEISRMTDLSVSDVKQVLYPHLQRTIVSLDQVVAFTKGTDRGATLESFIADKTTPNAETLIDARQELEIAQKQLAELLARFSQFGISLRDQNIFKALYGIGEFDTACKLAKIAQQHDISRERARQIIEKIWVQIQKIDAHFDSKQLKTALLRIDELRKIASLYT